MSEPFFARFQAWPYSSGDGELVDQARAGAREQSIVFRADDIHDAVTKAVLFQQGMLTNPRVWKARIVEVRTAGHSETGDYLRGDVMAENEARQEYARRARAVDAAPPTTARSDETEGAGL